MQIKHFRRGAHSNGGNTLFWKQQLTGKQLLNGEKGRKTVKTHSESAFGWVRIGWVLGCSLIVQKNRLVCNIIHNHLDGSLYQETWNAYQDGAKAKAAES